MSPQKCRRLFEALRAANPEPRSELQFTSPFELLIAVMLSAQATDRSVNLATGALFAIANTPQAILQLGSAGLKRHIRTIGLYNTKARNILATCRLLVQRHGGQVPRERAALEELPGVGRKTANIVLNVAFGEHTLGVDTHVLRVANRTGLSRGASPREVEDDLLRIIPAEFLHDAHHWLVLHGRYVCKARRPECPQCRIARWCEFPHKAAVAAAAGTAGTAGSAARAGRAGAS
jgi:endonuclease III